MARFKKIYKDAQHELDKKRERIRRIVCNALAVFWIAAVCICGVFQHNDTVVGIGCIAISTVNTAYCIFAFRIRYLGWKVMTIYDSDELYRDKYRLPQKHIEQEEKDIKQGRLLLDVLIAITVVVFFVFGIVKLV